MMYVAKCYVSIAGRVLRPGDAFEAGSEDAKISRLLRLNAITAVKPSFANASICPDQGGTDANREQTEDHGAPCELPDDTVGENDGGDAPADEESDEDADAPEIDGMDGIVSGGDDDTAAKEEAPRKTGRRTKK